MFGRITVLPADEEIHSLVARALGGDDRARDLLFEALLSLFRYQARSVSVYFGIDPQEIDDLVQEVALHFLDDSRGQLWRIRLWHEQQDLPFVHYAARVCRNKLYDLCRREIRTNSHLLDQPLEKHMSAQLDDVDSWAFAEVVRLCLASLPSDYREALWLHYVLEYTVKELAARLKITPVVAQGLIARARAKFRMSFTEQLRCMDGDAAESKADVEPEETT